MKNYNHIILTRFNLETPGVERTFRERAGWLDRRIDLFEKFCLPSVVSQTVKNFKWIIYADVRTPERHQSKFFEYAQHDVVDIRWVDGHNFSLSNVRADIKCTLSTGCNWLITTRLDNDDAIHRTYVEKIQAYCSFRRREGINFTRGLILSEGRLYVSRDLSNAFISLSEPTKDMLTVWCRQHTDIKLVAPILRVDDAPVWLQVVHGENVVNQKKGVRVRSDPVFFSGFVFKHTELIKDSNIEVGFENLVCFPIRYIRDTMKNTIRAIMHLMEKYFGISLSEIKRRWRERHKI